MPSSPQRAAARRETMYMHTIDGKPAYYVPRQQIVFAGSGRYARKGLTLVPSIQQIKAEQKASTAWRTKQGFTSSLDRYGYVRVEVPRVR